LVDERPAVGLIVLGLAAGGDAEAGDQRHDCAASKVAVFFI